MARSPKAFLSSLYEEYLEEASFLYEQRVSLFEDQELTWKAAGEFEARFEPHIDGLVVGGEAAMEICVDRLHGGDFGELHAAICVFCRQSRRDLVVAALDQVDLEDPQKAAAFADALKYELPATWVDDFLSLLDTGGQKLVSVLARVVGYRRVPCGSQLVNAMKHCTAQALPDLIWALGRVRHEPARWQLLDCLHYPDEPVRFAAAMALARLGEPTVVDYCLDQAGCVAWPVLILGLAGGSCEPAVLSELAKKHGSTCLTSIGLLGDPASIPLLLSHLDQPAAAAALHCITGAGLYEISFVPDVPDEDELFDSERDALKGGKPLDRGDGRPFGSMVTRLSQNVDDWNRWWRKNGNRFTPGVRYCYGAPVSPAQIIRALASDSDTAPIRRYRLEELAIRYGEDLGMETDTPVARQSTVLSEVACLPWMTQGQFEEGAWYFARHRLQSQPRML